MEDLLLKCDVHKDETLKMFCQDHSQLCCSDCVLLNHRQCTSVALISASAKKLSLDMQKLSINLQNILDQLNMFKRSQEASIQLAEVSYSVKLQEIQDMRNKLNASLDELEKTTLTELDEIRATLQTSLKKNVANCIRLKDELQQLGEAVHSLGEKSKKEIELIASRKFLEKIQESETYLKDNPVKAQSSIIFKADIDIEQYLSKKSGLGRIVVMNPDQVLTVKKMSEYYVKISSDKRLTCFIGCICILPSGHVIIVDQENVKVKLFDQQFNVVSNCDMAGGLRDICLISSSEVAVIIDCYVQFISVRNGQLITEKFQLSHGAYGIANHNEALYVTSGTALYHYTLTETLVKTLYEDTRGGNTVRKCAVSPAGDRIYVTNFSQDKLLTLAMDGTLISTFTDPELQCPWGVYVTSAGQVLVCGHNSNTVIQVDCVGKKKLATLTGVIKPWSVSVNKNIDQIIVGLNYENKIIVMELH